MISPVSNVLLEIAKPLQDEIITESGLKFYMDGSYNKEWNATVSGKIAALPKARTPKEAKILSQLQVGDEVCFSYQVVADLDFKSDRDRFMEVLEGNDMMQEFRNSLGDKIIVCALPGKISPIWIGALTNKFGQWIDGCQGNEHDVNRWKSQFKFGKTDDYTFINFFEFEGKDYWKCPVSFIFAKKTEDGHLQAVGDRVIMKPVEQDVPRETREAMGIITTTDVKIRFIDRGRVITGGKDKGFKKDQILHFDSAICERYEFYNKNYYLVNEEKILGVWSKN
jgi:co-chaperonin GroES (HSP10)